MSKTAIFTIVFGFAFPLVTHAARPFSHKGFVLDFAQNIDHSQVKSHHDHGKAISIGTEARRRSSQKISQYMELDDLASQSLSVFRTGIIEIIEEQSLSSQQDADSTKIETNLKKCEGWLLRQDTAAALLSWLRIRTRGALPYVIHGHGLSRSEVFWSQAAPLVLDLLDGCEKWKGGGQEMGSAILGPLLKAEASLYKLASVRGLSSKLNTLEWLKLEHNLGAMATHWIERAQKASTFHWPNMTGEQDHQFATESDMEEISEEIEQDNLEVLQDSELVAVAASALCLQGLSILLRSGVLLSDGSTSTPSSFWGTWRRDKALHGALECFKKALQVEPDGLRQLYLAGWTELELGQVPEAGDHFHAALFQGMEGRGCNLVGDWDLSPVLVEQAEHGLNKCRRAARVQSIQQRQRRRRVVKNPQDVGYPIIECLYIELNGNELKSLPPTRGN